MTVRYRVRYVIRYTSLLVRRLHVIVPLLVLYVFLRPELWAVLVAMSLWWWFTHA